jgi:uncharacterized protein YhjY with autotransporter beta-barrel domain
MFQPSIFVSINKQLHDDIELIINQLQRYRNKTTLPGNTNEFIARKISTKQAINSIMPPG